MVEKVKDKNINFIPLNFSEDLFIIAFKLFRLTKKKQIDIIHVYLSKSQIIAFSIKIINSGIPVITTIHGTYETPVITNNIYMDAYIFLSKESFEF